MRANGRTIHVRIGGTLYTATRGGGRSKHPTRSDGRLSMDFAAETSNVNCYRTWFNSNILQRRIHNRQTILTASSLNSHAQKRNKKNQGTAIPKIAIPALSYKGGTLQKKKNVRHFHYAKLLRNIDLTKVRSSFRTNARSTCLGRLAWRKT